MKKTLKLTIFTAIIAVVCVFSLTGCSNTPYYKYLNTNWDETKTEVATYNYVYSKTGQADITGTMTTSVKRVKATDSVSINGEVIAEHSAGSYYTYTLNLTNGDLVEAEVFLTDTSTRAFMPVKSYYHSSVGAVDTKITNVYAGNNCYSSVSKNGQTAVTTKLDFGKGNQVYDNTQLHLMARATNFSQSISWNFETPILQGDTMNVNTVAYGATTTLKFNEAPAEGQEADTTFNFINDGKEFTAKLMVLTINEKPSGVAQSVYVANNTYKIGTETFNQPIIRIIEGSLKFGKSVFTLTNMTKI